MTMYVSDVSVNILRRLSGMHDYNAFQVQDSKPLPSKNRITKNCMSLKPTSSR